MYMIAFNTKAYQTFHLPSEHTPHCLVDQIVKLTENWEGSVSKIISCFMWASTK